MKDFGDFGFGMISQMVNWGLNQASMGIQQDYNRANMTYQNYLNKELMGLQNKYNTDAATTAYERQKALYNQYMTPEAQLMMLQKAGLSPALMYAKGGSSGASMPNVQQAAGTGLPGTGLPSVTALGMSSTLAQELKNIEEYKLMKEEARGKRIENDEKQREFDFGQEIIYQTVEAALENGNSQASEKPIGTRWELQRQAKYNSDQETFESVANKMRNEKDKEGLRWLWYNGQFDTNELFTEDEQNKLFEKNGFLRELKAELDQVTAESDKAQIQAEFEKMSKGSLSDVVNTINNINTGNKTIDTIIKMLGQLWLYTTMKGKLTP